MQGVERVRNHIGRLKLLIVSFLIASFLIASFLIALLHSARLIQRSTNLESVAVYPYFLLMHLLLPAAGVGRRMGANRNKLLMSLSKRPIFSWTLEAAAKASSLSWIGIICQPVDQPDFERMVEDLKASGTFKKTVEFIQGGETRQASVFNGLQALPSDATHVLIHDGARCLATPELFNRCAEAALQTQGFIAAVPVKDTIKQVDAQRTITHTPDRAQLWAAQTPQGFEVALLKECHVKGKSQGWQVTDDAALLEKCGVPVKIVEGEETNLKVTTPMDLVIAQFILQSRDR